MSPINLHGRRVLVLGGSGVLGRLIAGELKARGAEVILAGRDSERLASAASAIGPNVPCLVSDLGDPDAIKVIDAAIAQLGGIDGVVNAAGVVAFGPLSDTSDEVLEELVTTDFLGPLRVIRSALPHLEDGFIVNVTGVVAETPYAGLVAYSAVKAGLSAATRALGSELRRQGIHVLDARPPHTETGLAERPIDGTAPKMPPGLDPASVAHTIVDGLADGVRELPAEAFSA